MPGDQRAVVVLQRAGHELRRARRARVHEHHDRIPPLRSPERALHAPRVGDLWLPSIRRVHDAAARQELPRHRRRFRHASAAVVAQVEQQAPHATLLQPVERGVQIVRHALAHERRDAHVAGERIQQRRHRHCRLAFDALALDRTFESHRRAVIAQPLERQPRGGFLLATQLDVQLEHAVSDHWPAWRELEKIFSGNEIDLGFKRARKQSDLRCDF